MLKSYLIAAFSFVMFLYQIRAQNDTIDRKVPAELLFKEIKQSNYRISPNGKLFLEVLEENYESHIVIIDIDGYKLKNRISMGVTDIGEVIWLTNSRILYQKLGEIFAIDIDGSNKVKLVDRKAEKRVKNYYKYYLNYRYNSILSLSTEDEDEILVEAFDGDGNSYVKKVNVFTGEKKTVYDGKKLKVNKWFADKRGNVNLGVRYDDDEWEYVRENTNSGEWFPIQINLNGNFYPFKVEGESLLKDNILLVDTDFDDEIIYLASNIGIDKRELLKYNFKKRYLVSTIASDVNCDIMGDEGNDIRILFDKKNMKLGAIRYEGLLPEFKPVSKSFLEIKNILNSKYQVYVNDIIDYDDKFERFVIYQWSDVYAGNIGVYDAKSDAYYVMFHINEELNNYRLSKTKNISIKTEDDFVLSSYLNLPLDYDEKKQVPMVVIPHGGPWVRDYWGLDSYSQFFSSRGFAVLRVNYRGSTGFGKRHLQAGIKGIGSAMISDIVQATRKVVEDFNVDEKQLFIFGHSYGGYATYMALAKYPELYRAGVALAAPTDIKRILKKQKKEGNNFSYDFWTYALGDKDSEYLEQVSPLNYVEEIDSPLLVFHGKFDKVVPIEQSEEMKKEFEKKGKTNATFRTIEFLGHNLEDSNSLGYVLKEAVEFFQEKTK